MTVTTTVVGEMSAAAAVAEMSAAAAAEVRAMTAALGWLGVVERATRGDQR